MRYAIFEEAENTFSICSEQSELRQLQKMIASMIVSLSVESFEVHKYSDKNLYSYF